MTVLSFQVQSRYGVIDIKVLTQSGVISLQQEDNKIRLLKEEFYEFDKTIDGVTKWLNSK